MSTPIKIILSLASIVAAMWGYNFMVALGQTVPSYAVIFLGVAGVAMTWIFPEVVSHTPSRNGRRR